MTPCYYCEIGSDVNCKTCIHSDTYEEPVALKELSDDVAKHHYNKGHEDGRKLATVKELTQAEIELQAELIVALEALNEVCKKHLYPCPDKPSNDWAKVMKADAVLKKARGEE